MVSVSGGSIRIAFALFSVPATADGTFTRQNGSPFPVIDKFNAHQHVPFAARTYQIGILRASFRRNHPERIAFFVPLAGDFAQQTLMVASAAAQASGLPPKVVVCRKGLSNNRKHPSVAMVAPIGITPPPVQFRQTREYHVHFRAHRQTSAGTPYAGFQKISSRIISAPNSSQSLRTSVTPAAAGSRRLHPE